MLVSTTRSFEFAGGGAASKSLCRRCKPIALNQSGIAGKAKGPFSDWRQKEPVGQLINACPALEFPSFSGKEPDGSHARLRKKHQGFHHGQWMQTGGFPPPRQIQDPQIQAAKIELKRQFGNDA
jgi:hypothetical protein